MKRWFKRIGLGLLGIYLLICLGMYFFQESFIFHPLELEEEYVFSFEGSWEEIWLDAEDGGRVNCVLFHTEQPKGVVLYTHGNSGNIETSAPGAWKMVQRNGYDMLAVDYRSFGKSRGDLSQEGMYMDVEAAWQYLRSRYSAERITIFGSSMGSGLASHVAKIHPPKKLILQAAYTSIKDVAQGNYPWLPIGLLIKYPFPSLENLKEISSDILILHGTADGVIPYEHGQALAEAAPKAKFISLKGAGHNNIRDYPEFHRAFDTFLQQP